MNLLPTDLRFAARIWRKRPLLVAAAVLTLALGTGANTAIFSVIYAVVLRPLPYAQPERLVQIWSADVDGRGRLDRAGKKLTWSGTADRWRQADTAFEHIGCYRAWNFSVAAASGQPERLYAAVVSADFFDESGVFSFGLGGRHAGCPRNRRRRLSIVLAKCS